MNPLTVRGNQVISALSNESVNNGSGGGVQNTQVVPYILDYTAANFFVQVIILLLILYCNVLQFAWR